MNIPSLIIKKLNISVIQNNIVDEPAQAIVNAANAYLSQGGGVCGAIFDACGSYKLSKECRKILESDQYKDKRQLKVSEVVITKSFKLSKTHQKTITHILHAVGPIWKSDYYQTKNYNEKKKSQSDQQIQTQQQNQIISQEPEDSKNFQGPEFPQIPEKIEDLENPQNHGDPENLENPQNHGDPEKHQIPEPPINLIQEKIKPNNYQREEEQQLYDCVDNILKMSIGSKDLQINTVSIPAISSGIYGFPKDRCAQIFFDAIQKFDQSELTEEKFIRLTNYDKETCQYFWTEMQAIKSSPLL